MFTNHSLKARLARAVASTLLLGLGMATPARAQNPSAAFKGLAKLGVVVEELGSDAVACGLSQGAIQKMASTMLTEGGLQVLANSDEDTYLYLNVKSLKVPTNICVSRYDVFLYTHTTARLSYGDQATLVQVELMHQAGLSGGGVNGHAEHILENLRQYVEQIVAGIRLANTPRRP